MPMFARYITESEARLSADRFRAFSDLDGDRRWEEKESRTGRVWIYTIRADGRLVEREFWEPE
jgi:hypothetical protein